ncbi:hypothetical protein POWCR01_000174300 [Plasmodium ovale]|uniref:Uncharacterized protein n=1 Tax=Plasmodium ovale TaxID=36330 RepID=A0A1C3KJR9_PLAOA|nr:hypothetical protein POWCR01_000174300 [Plasmodium ovale]
MMNYVNTHGKKDLDSARSEDLDYCDILNTWLNYRKVHILLMENHVKKESYGKNLRMFFLNKINNKGIISNISEEESQQSLEHFENFYPSSLRNRINVINNTLGSI